MDLIKNNIFDFSINQTSYFRIKKTIFFNIVNFKEIRKLILSLIDLNKESELKIFISSDSDEFSLKFLEQIINTFSKEDKIKVFLTKQQEHISFSLFSFIAKKIKFDYSFYVSTNNFRQEVNFSIFDLNFNFIKNDVFAKLQNIFLNKIFTEIENNINKQSTFTIVKRKKIEEEYINKIIEEFYFWKKETKLLSIGFLNSNSDVKKFQEKLIGRLDFKFIYSKMSFFKLKWLNLVYFSFFKKPDLLVDLDDEKEKVTFYVKEMKKYRKLNNYELFFLITHFLNKKLKKYKIKLNTELDMVFNLETVFKRLENNYSEKEMILFFKNDLSLCFEKENIFYDFSIIKIILLVSFLNYEKTQNFNFIKINELLKKIYNFNELTEVKLYINIEKEEIIDKIQKKGFTLIFSNKENNSSNFFSYFENKLSEKIWFFYNFSSSEAKILFFKKSSLKFKGLINKLIKEVKNDY